MLKSIAGRFILIIKAEAEITITIEKVNSIFLCFDQYLMDY